MKRLLIAFLVALTLNAFSQGGTWVWIKGSDTIGTPNVAYPIQGVSDTANNPPALFGAANWTDLEGNFWMFGGCYALATGYLRSDLWKYSPANNSWTWVKGPGIPSQKGIYGAKAVPSDSAEPGARYFSSNWTDANGDLWLFGGNGIAPSNHYPSAYGSLNDLWKYHIATNQWTWMNGNNSLDFASISYSDTPVYGIKQQPSILNNPGGRYGCSCWMDDNNNLWLFGGANFIGRDFSPYPYNDVWKYSIASNEWTWMNGAPPIILNLGNYGTRGVESPLNLPPPRSGAPSWKDAGGNFYLFGGEDDLGSQASLYNDVWEYKPTSNSWVWLSGDSVCVPSGNRESNCANNRNAFPNSRSISGESQSSCQADISFMFGGQYFGGVNGDTTWSFNDLWVFNSGSVQWKWVSGPSTPNDIGDYGTRNIQTITNLPPSRLASCQWVDNYGVFWMFGGLKNFTGSGYLYNDLWKFVPDTSCMQGPISGGLNYMVSKNSICKGDSALLTLSGDVNVHISPQNNTSQIDSTHFWLYPDTTTTFIIHGQSYCGNDEYLALTIQVHTHFNVAIMMSDTAFCKGDSVMLCAPYGYDSYLWSNGQTNTCLYTTLPGNYSVSVGEKPHCTGTSDTVNPIFFNTLPVTINEQGDTLSAQGETYYRWQLNGSFISGALRAQLIAISPGVYVVTAIDSNGCYTTSQPIIISGISNKETTRMSISPNPANEKIWCNINASFQNAILSITSLDGRIVFQTSKVAQNSFELDVSQLAAGAYLLVIDSDSGKWVKKFMKE